jgi:hypothetical protein
VISHASRQAAAAFLDFRSFHLLLKRFESSRAPLFLRHKFAHRSALQTFQSLQHFPRICRTFRRAPSLILCRLQDTSLCSPHVHRSAVSRAVAVVSLNITLASALEPKALEALHKAVFEISGGDPTLKTDMSQYLPPPLTTTPHLRIENFSCAGTSCNFTCVLIV